ncbi:formate dehydrogenase subunit gamma [Tepidamorphus sp. 3E244]|uniref:formate dehydrogenase subunit gamma n=1 Tax=Tepidamorphus sp. 3E244 TaxID=3385498 RepID=UPI0038FCA4E6
MHRTRIFGLAGLFAMLALVVAVTMSGGQAFAQSGGGLDPELRQQLEGGAVPGNAQGTNDISEQWRDIRRGVQGTVSIPDKKAGVLVQSEGENWRNVRNGPVSTYSVWVIAGMIILLAVFFLIRGRIRIDAGKAGVTINRFGFIERFGHWLLAVSFIVLALTGLNLLYGRYWLLPVIGPDAFGAITLGGKYLHNYLAFAFMLGLAMVTVMWIVHNLPSRHDLIWLAKGGGMFSKKSHPPAKKFNAGQKIIFWSVVLGGLSLSLSGWALLFPFEYPMFAKTFAIFNIFGTELPTSLTPIEEQQLAQLWHTIVAVVMVAIILAHIYIGTIGMEGAFDAMGSGDVDLNWAKEHHSIWVEEKMEGDGEHPETRPAPAE